MTKKQVSKYLSDRAATISKRHKQFYESSHLLMTRNEKGERTVKL